MACWGEVSRGLELLSDCGKTVSTGKWLDSVTGAALTLA